MRLIQGEKSMVPNERIMQFVHWMGFQTFALGIAVAGFAFSARDGDIGNVIFWGVVIVAVLVWLDRTEKKLKRYLHRPHTPPTPPTE